MTNTDSKGAAPFFDWKGVHGLPVFSNLDDDAFRPAFEVAMAEHNREIEAIAGNHDTPDFANTIDALELCGLKLSRVSALFWNRAGADTNETIRSLEREMAPLCLEENIGMIPWGPLGSGRLAGSHEAKTTRATSRAITGGAGRFPRPEDQNVVDTLRQVAEERGDSPAQIAVAWLLSRPGVTAPIIGASKLHQLDDLIRAVDTKLSEEETARLEAPYVAQKPMGLADPNPVGSIQRKLEFGLPAQ